MVKRMKIGYVSAIDPNDKQSWSGTHFSILNSLKKEGYDVDILGPSRPKLELLIGKILAVISQKISGKRFDYRHSNLLSKAYARYFEKKLKKKHFDFLIAPAASCEIAHLETQIPIVYVSDTTFKRSLGYHKALTNLSHKSEKVANAIEQLALTKSKLIIVSSEWAAESVKRDYGISKKHIRIIPFGPNMNKIPDKSKLKSNFDINQIELLFPAVYWENKGGDIALNCLKKLQAKKINARLTVVGCIPPEEARKTKGLEYIAYLNKNDSTQLKQLQELFLRSDFLILPTRFDCTPVVFCEASAFGLPSLCSDTGGVRGHIHEGKNGFLFNYDDDGTGFAEKISELIDNPSEYEILRISSRKLFEEKLNWDQWRNHVLTAINEIF